MLTTSHGWNPAATIQSAVTAARNQQTVAYIGDLDSGATQLSLPILNQAGIVQLTPGSGYPGLTDDVKNVTFPLGEPNKYYPQSRPSLFRLVPNDIIQAAAIVDWLKDVPQLSYRRRCRVRCTDADRPRPPPWSPRSTDGEAVQTRLRASVSTGQRDKDLRELRP